MAMKKALSMKVVGRLSGPIPRPSLCSFTHVSGGLDEEKCAAQLQFRTELYTIASSNLHCSIDVSSGGCERLTEQKVAAQLHLRTQQYSTSASSDLQGWIQTRGSHFATFNPVEIAAYISYFYNGLAAMYGQQIIDVAKFVGEKFDLCIFLVEWCLVTGSVIETLHKQKIIKTINRLPHIVVKQLAVVLEEKEATNLMVMLGLKTLNLNAKDTDKRKQILKILNQIIKKFTALADKDPLNLDLKLKLGYFEDEYKKWESKVDPVPSSEDVRDDEDVRDNGGGCGSGNVFEEAKFEVSFPVKLRRIK